MPIIDEPEVEVSMYYGPHQWLCGETIFDLLIDGDSVKLGPKIFTSREIELLKTLNSNNSMTTYEMFQQIDSKTKGCEFDFGSLETKPSWSGYTYTWTGSYYNGKPDGVGFYENDIRIIYATLVDNEVNGFWIWHNKSYGEQYQSERRSNERDGLETYYSSS